MDKKTKSDYEYEAYAFLNDEERGTGYHGAYSPRYFQCPLGNFVVSIGKNGAWRAEWLPYPPVRLKEAE